MGNICKEFHLNFSKITVSTKWVALRIHSGNVLNLKHNKLVDGAWYLYSLQFVGESHLA